VIELRGDVRDHFDVNGSIDLTRSVEGMVGHHRPLPTNRAAHQTELLRDTAARRLPNGGEILSLSSGGCKPAGRLREEEGVVRDEDWRRLEDDALERLLIERWLHRGLMLCVIFAAAIVATYLGLRGITGLADQLTVGAMLALALAAGVAAFVMRQQDLRIHRELRQRRGSHPR
jgi:hypothetical protein